MSRIIAIQISTEIRSPLRLRTPQRLNPHGNGTGRIKSDAGRVKRPCNNPYRTVESEPPSPPFAGPLGVIRIFPTNLSVHILSKWVPQIRAETPSELAFFQGDTSLGGKVKLCQPILMGERNGRSSLQSSRRSGFDLWRRK